MVEADGSTLFLDEISGMPLDTQRGCSTCSTPGRSCRWALATREVDVRVIAASDGRLLEAVEAGRFREDLYYKLNTVHVAIPPLRDRADDARARQHLLDRIAQQPGLRWLGITEDARPAAPL
jgi:DNA-binding NtrC family response regulator